jgi:nitrogen fixation/metabolism regulation signal transduction histidine kinase
MIEPVAYATLGFALATLVGWRLTSMLLSRRTRDLADLVRRLHAGELDGLATAPRAAFPAIAALEDALLALGLTLKQREREVAQREQLLAALVEGAPMASLLLTDVGEILHTNRAARELFFEGQDPKDGNFLGLLQRAPEALRRAVAGEGDELFSIDDDEQSRQVYHLAKRHFDLDGAPVVLVVVNNLTRELHRQEAEVWKRMIRIMAHELNNSLAPISSMVHSARILSAGAENASKLAVVFDTVSERAEHLRSFLEGFAQFARLPAPRKTEVDWPPFLERLTTLIPSLTIDGGAPETKGWFDPAQLEQVLINLLKNAEEAGGPPGSVSLGVSAPEPGATRLVVRDCGHGMSPEVMKSALVPFYSTKEGGTGLGLPLCREIVEAHGGVLRLESREGGGLDVIVRLPSRDVAATGLGKLTLTRS